MICKIKDCEGKASIRCANMCLSHYKELGRNAGQEECYVLECDKEAHREGYCKYHWRNLRQFNTPIRPKWHGPLNSCAFPSCEREQARRTRKLCLTHENQKWRGEELAPIRPQRPADEPNHDWIECAGCQELRPKNMYYFRMRKQGLALVRRMCKDCLMDEQRERKGTPRKGWSKYGNPAS